MDQTQLLASLVQHTWLIDRTTGRMLLRQLLDGKAASEPNSPTLYFSLPQAVTEGTTETRSLASVLTQAMGQAMPGSVAVIVVDYPLYGWYASYIASRIQEAALNENVVGIICRINCPGGIDQAAYRLYDAISSVEKPTIALCEYGLMASAAYWFALGFDYIMASRETDLVGSIGVYSTFFDDTGFWESYGITVVDIYAPESSRKNEEYRAALEGDFSKIEANNSRVAKSFIATVKTHRGAKLKVTKSDDPTQGALYPALAAKANGLIDEVGNFERALQLMSGLASGKTIQDLTTSEPDPDDDSDTDPVEDDPQNPTAQSLNSNSDTSMFGDKHKALTALAGLADSAISDEKLNEVNANLAQLGITAVRVISNAYFTEAQNAVSALGTANANLTTANASITSLTAERDSWKAKAEAYGAQPGAVASKVEKKEESLNTEVITLSDTDAELQRMLAKQRAA